MADPQHQPRDLVETVSAFLPGAVVGAALVGLAWVLVAALTGGADRTGPTADPGGSGLLAGAGPARSRGRPCSTAATARRSRSPARSRPPCPRWTSGPCTSVP